MLQSLKFTALALGVLASPVLAQDVDPATLTCADFMALEGDAKGAAAIAVIAASPRVGALAGIEGYSPVALITEGCEDDGTLTAVAAAEKGLDD